MNKKGHKNLLMGGMLASLALLPSCGLLDMFKSKSEEQTESVMSTQEPRAEMLTGDVVATMNDEPIVTTDSIAAAKEELLKSKPELRSVLPFMDPKVLDLNLTNGLVSQAIVDEYVREKGIDKTAEYQKELADIIKNMKRILNAKFFSQQYNVSVSDAEVKNFYETNKSAFPELIISQGGVVASGIQFEDEMAAKEFMAQVKAAGNNFVKAAQQAGKANAIKDFKMVNAQSIGIDPVLRDKIMAVKAVPSVEMVKTKGAVWVVNMASKEEPQYVPFDQVKVQIKALIENNKRGELFQKDIDKLKEKYNVVVKEDYFKSEASAMSPMQAPMPFGEMEDEDMTAQMGGVADATKENSSKRVA